jgi:1,4-dihydroxy-2-naphthoyl-CoA synthase
MHADPHDEAVESGLGDDICTTRANFQTRRIDWFERFRMLTVHSHCLLLVCVSKYRCDFSPHQPEVSLFKKGGGSMAELVMVKKADGIATVLLNRPEAFNAFNMDLMKAFVDTIITLAANERVRGIIISGEGKAFCAGGDLKWALAFPRGPSAAFHELAARFHQAILEIRRIPKPVIAAVNGHGLHPIGSRGCLHRHPYYETNSVGAG